MVPFWVMFYSLCFSYLFVSPSYRVSWEPVPASPELIMAYKAGVPMKMVGFEKLFPCIITVMKEACPHGLEKGKERQY